MEIKLALIIQLSDTTEGLHGWFVHIPISSGATAVLVFCGFVSGSVIINVISWIRVIKPSLNHCIPWHIYAYYYTLRKPYYEPCRSTALQLGVVATSNQEEYTRGYSLHTFLCYENIWKKWRTVQPLIQYVTQFKTFWNDCFALKGSSYWDAVEIPAKKPDTLLTGYFPKLSESRFMVTASNGPSDPSQRQTSERR